MAPFLPVLSVSRSQNIRIGDAQLGALGGRAVGEANDTINGVNPLPTYVDLGDPRSRRDLQRHSALGGLVHVGTMGNVSSPYFFSAAPAVTNGTAGTISVAAGVLVPRFYGTVQAGYIQTPAATVAVAAVTNLAFAVANATLPRTDLVVATPVAGVFVYSIVTGVPIAGAGVGTVPFVSANQITVAWYTVAAAATVASTITAIAPTS